MPVCEVEEEEKGQGSKREGTGIGAVETVTSLCIRHTEPNLSPYVVDYAEG